MKIKPANTQFPLKIEISFEKLFDSYREQLKTGSSLLKARAEEILKIAEAYPILEEGIESPEVIEKYQSQIDLILEDLFAGVLQKNEIKIATIPFQEAIFQSTERYKNIIKTAGPDFEMSLMNFDEDQFYIMGCSVILNAYYGYKVDFRRPFYYEIPDAQGIVRHYRVLYNADFMTIEKTEDSIEITDKDVAELLDNFNNIDLWKEKFPENSWSFKGFIIANMYDATTDVSLSNFKANLLENEAKDQNFVLKFETIIQAIFNLPKLKVGYSIYNHEERSFEHPPSVMNVSSYILNGEMKEHCDVSLCEFSHKALMVDHQAYCISDVKRFHQLYPQNTLYKKLADQQIGSAIITPLVGDGKFLGLMEIVSPNAKELNSINANKLEDIMPFLVDSVQRSIEKKENLKELLIQSECTSIHPSVHWKFKQEAERVLKASDSGNDLIFREIVFEKVFPLFGQIDIKGSSEARNEATKKDLLHQLKLVQKIIKKTADFDPLPIYEQLDYRLEHYKSEIEENLEVDTERRVLNFLKNEIVPLYKHLQKKDERFKKLVQDYNAELDEDKGFVYKYRKDYDESVMLVNRSMARVLDGQQQNAQKMYPHYFERFKTDGVEHNMYIGESITKHKSFNKIYLYNLRLWQLQVMCDMENSFYMLKKHLPVPMNAASMILVFNSSLSLRFRMDEKRFDVDGTYNARYEVVKKRVDKAKIKGTDERITQPGHITIIYSQKKDEREYLKYIQFLQSKQQLGDIVEIHELEDLQGVTGLMALRVNVLYNLDDKDKEYYTYDDLMEEISN